MSDDMKRSEQEPTPPGPDQAPSEPDPDGALRPTTGLEFGFETKALVAAAMIVTVGGFSALFLDIPGWLSGDTDLFGNYRFEQKLEQRKRNFSPLERVHADLFPQWLVYHARPPNRRPEGQPEATLEKLRSHLADESLRDIVATLRSSMRSDSRRRLSESASTAMDRWNGRLEQLGEPFFVRLRTATRRGHSFIYGAFYRRLAQPAIRVGSEDHEALLLRRIDDTNLFESFLGLARGDAPYAFVVTDRVLDFGVDDILPVVAAGTDRSNDEHPDFSSIPSLDDVSQSFAADVRSAVREGLGDERYRRLERVARAHTRLRSAVRSIRSRRDCSQFRISDPPWNGYTPRTLDRLEAYAERDEIQSCPTVEYDEADAIRAATDILQRPKSERAYESMVALLSRVIAIHEARHRADYANEARGAPECETCPERASTSTRAELSAYVASVAWSESPALALFQACRARVSGAHRRALALFLDRLGTLCDGEIPDELGDRSRGIERELFGRSDEIRLPDDFPTRLDLRMW